MPMTATAISIEKTATLLQNLVDLRKQSYITFPSIIETSVTELLNAQEIFAKRIDEYMHYIEHDVSELETMRVIIETHPEFMATKETEGELPIHRSAYDHSSASTFVPLLANEGRQYGIGGVDGRGGLLVKSEGTNVYENLIMEYNSIDTFKALMNIEPTLLHKQDVRDYHLLHFAVTHGKIEIIKLMVEMDPSCLYSCDEKDQMPIACSSQWHSNMYGVDETGDEEDQTQEQKEEQMTRKKLDVLKYILEAAIVHDANHPSLGGLFNKGIRNRLALVNIIGRFGKEVAWDCIEQVLSRFDNLPILHQTILNAPYYASSIWRRFPDSFLVRDDRNRLPIHVALESGMKWSSVLVAIINANRPHLKDRDPVTNFPLFALAAMEQSCDLRTAYYLLMKNPEQAEKVDVANLESNPEQNSKGKKRRLNE